MSNFLSGDNADYLESFDEEVLAQKIVLGLKEGWKGVRHLGMLEVIEESQCLFKSKLDL